MRKIKLIGLTGQSGAGKSTVSEIFAQQGAHTVNADELVRRLYNPGGVCLAAVAAAFGSDVINPDGSANRRVLPQKAFKRKESTKKLNEIVHPFVTAELIKEIKKAISGGKTVVVYDAPQLFESGFDVLCDLTAGVCADENIRLKRICARDGIDENRARQRISAQHGEEFFRRSCDIIIENNGDPIALRADVRRILNEIQSTDAAPFQSKKVI